MEQATGFRDQSDFRLRPRCIPSVRRQDEVILLSSLLASFLNKDDSEIVTARLFQKFGTLRNIMHASKLSLNKTTSLGDRVYAELRKIRDLAVALSRSEIEDQPVFDQYEKVITYCRTLLAGENLEQFHAIFLGKSYQLIGDARIRSGTVDHVTVYPRELIECAMSYQASGIILVHNHPSGVAEPSRADINMTRALVQVGNILGMAILDHLIVGRHSTYSFREHNLIGN